MINNKRQTVLVNLNIQVDQLTLEGTIDSVIYALTKFKNDYPSKKLCLKWEERRWEDGGDYYLHEERLETDKEYKERLRQELREDRETKRFDLKRLAELKKKYENA